jgi:hypothetical protein
MRRLTLQAKMTAALNVLGAFSLAAVLAACGTAAKPEPSVRIVEKRIPVPTACVTAATPQPPTYPDDDEAVRAAPSPGIRYSLIAAGRLLRIQRLAEIEPVLQACRAPTATGPDGPPLRAKTANPGSDYLG